jgi:flagellin
MALTVTTNLSALNAERHLSRSGALLSKAMERLSSGQRINGAADDAAGLAIATRMGAQVRGLNQAVRNANDGIAMLQTAEGAMAEITNIVTRVKELAIQSANGSNSSTDRSSLNDEVTALVAEITRIASQTKFGSTALLDGSFNGTFQVGVEAGQTITQAVASMKASSLSGSVGTQSLTLETGLTSLGAANANTFLGLDSTTDLLVEGPLGNAYARVTTAADDGVSNIEKMQSAIALAKSINEQTSVTGVSATATAAVFTVADNAERFDDVNIDGVAEGVWINGTAVVVNLDTGGQATNRQKFIDAVNSQVSGVVASAGAGNGGLVLTAADGRNISIRTLAGVADGDAAEEVFGFTTAPTTEGVAARGGVTLQAAGSFTTTLATAGAQVGGEGTATAVATALSSINVSSVSASNTAMLVADSILSTISTERGKLGAVQNRLSSTIANLQVVAEKVSDAKSRILDADFAAETAAMTKAQILQQAGVSILAQANAVPQAALTLLRG